MCSINERSKCDGDYYLSTERCDSEEGLCQEEAGCLAALPSCSNNEGSDNKSLVLDHKEFYTLEPELERIEETVDRTKYEHELAMKAIVDSYGDNSNFCHLMKELISDISGKFTSVNVCEEYKYRNCCSSFLFSRINDEPSKEDVVASVLRVAVNIVIGLDFGGCDFLLGVSDRIRRYFVSNLGISEQEVTRLLLKTEVLEEVAGYSEEKLKSMTPTIVTSLLVDLNYGCLYCSGYRCYRENRYYHNILFRSFLNREQVAFFLRKVVSLLVFFPEGLHPLVVFGGINRKFFDVFFTLEGRCRVRR